MRITTKRLITATLITALAVSALTGCRDTKKQSETAPDGMDIIDASGDGELEEIIDPGSIVMRTEEDDVMNITGGWSNSEVFGSALSEEAGAALDKALENYEGMTFRPITLLGSQVVAGLNYAILCEAAPVVPDPVYSLKVVIVYARFDGTAEITSVSDFSVADFNTGDIAEFEAGLRTLGGWQVSDAPACALPEEAATAFTTAVADHSCTIEPLALLSTQVVAGLNYSFFVRVTPAGEDSMSSAAVMIVYRDLSGNATITSLVPLKIGNYRQ